MKGALLISASLAAAAGPLWPRAPSAQAGKEKEISTAPSNVAEDAKSFTLNQVRNEKYRAVDVPSEFFRTHAKYSTNLDPRIKSAIEGNPSWKSKFASMVASGTGGEHASVKAMPAPGLDTEFVVPVQLGTPGETLYLDLDTGSSDLWVLSRDTYKSQVNGHVVYHPGKSSTSKLLEGSSWVIKYGDDSSASGIVYSDRVTVGNITFATQSIESAVTVSSSISADTFSSGILGLAAGFGNTVQPTPQQTFMENVKGALAQPLFTANLVKGAPGSYTFGQIDKSSYYGHLQYTSVDPQVPYWHFGMSGYQVGEVAFQARPWSAIADTGTTLLLAPDDIVFDYYRHAKGQVWDAKSSMFLIPCDVAAPDFFFGIEDYRGLIPGQYLTYGNANATYCYGGVQIGNGLPFAVAGDILLKAQFVVFDYGSGDGVTGRTIGFANKKLQLK